MSAVDVRRMVFRSAMGRVLGWVWMAFAALNLIDVAIRGREMSSAVVVVLLLLGCGLAYVLGLRPRIVADGTGVAVHNPLRDVRIPWPAVREIEATDAIVIRYSGPAEAERSVRSWVLQSSPRGRARAEARTRRDAQNLPDGVAAKAKDRTPAGYAAERLTELADAGRRAGGAAEGVAAWSRPALAALAAPGVLAAAVLLIAVL